MIPADQKQNRFLITTGVMAATVMQVLDTTIVNVALPDMQGTFSATPDQISWVLTSYLVASAIFMPLTGFFSDKLGRKKYLMASILGFTVASALCGLSATLSEIVIFRLLQGIFGAALVPLSQAILVDTYPKEERGKAMAIWGMGIMVGPILGPTLGGYLTDTFNWRWTFYINLPVGILSLIMAWQVVPDTERRQRTLDWLGLTCIAIAIGATQYVLDRGNQEDWFESDSIKILAISAIAGFISYVLLSIFRKSVKPIFEVELFEDRNFVSSCIIMTAMGLGLFGSMVIQALMLENLLLYPTFTAGLTMAPRGIASMVSMIFVGKYATRISPRTFITIGIFLNAIATYIGTFYYLDISSGWVIWPSIIQGLGIGFVMIPLSTIALSTLGPHLITEGAGLFSLMRTFGFSMGISAVATILTRHTQIAWNNLSGFLKSFSPSVLNYLDNFQLTPNDPLSAVVLAKELARQAQMVAIVDIYIAMTWSFVLMLPLVFLLKSSSVTTSIKSTALME
jgi:DHA2 family multidrug resistance protein